LYTISIIYLIDMASQPIDQGLVWKRVASILRSPTSDLVEKSEIKLVKERASAVMSDSAMIQLFCNVIQNGMLTLQSMRALIHMDFPELVCITETSIGCRRTSFLGERVARLQSMEADGQHTVQKQLGNVDLNSVVSCEMVPLDSESTARIISISWKRI
jgi:hypothetical protein